MTRSQRTFPPSAPTFKRTIGDGANLQVGRFRVGRLGKGGAPSGAVVGMDELSQFVTAGLGTCHERLQGRTVPPPADIGIAHGAVGILHPPEDHAGKVGGNVAQAALDEALPLQGHEALLHGLTA
jgi:hypothetical protein